MLTVVAVGVFRIFTGVWSVLWFSGLVDLGLAFCGVCWFLSLLWCCFIVIASFR